MHHRLLLPLSSEQTAPLRAGDTVSLTGTLYTARDAAHKRLVACLATPDFPFELEGATLYYVGPTPARPGQAIGAAGPTTSGRMDAYTPDLLAHGLMAMIGKGVRSQAVVDAMRRRGAVYLGAIGGAGALLSSRIQEARVIAFPELGPEAVHRLEVEDFPAVVVIDSRGESLYQSGRAAYLAGLE